MIVCTAHQFTCAVVEKCFAINAITIGFKLETHHEKALLHILHIAIAMHWHLINSRRRAERTFPCWYSTLQTNSLVLMWTNAMYRQAVQLLLHASWRSWETYHEEALLHKRLHWDGRREAKAALLIVHTAHSPHHWCQIQRAADENSAIQCGIMDDSCWPPNAIFLHFFPPTLSAPELSRVWWFTPLLKLDMSIPQYYGHCILHVSVHSGAGSGWQKLFWLLLFSFCWKWDNIVTIRWLRQCVYAKEVLCGIFKAIMWGSLLSSLLK